MSVLSKPIPDDHLLAIFTRLSLPTLLRLPLVCAAWSSLQPTACRQIHTLVLSIRRPDQSSFMERGIFTACIPVPRGQLSLSTLLLFPLHQAVLRCLLHLFPLIRNLTLDHSWFGMWSEKLTDEHYTTPICRLLRAWEGSLLRLRLFIRLSFRSLTFQTTGLSLILSVINTLPILKHLRLSLWTYLRPQIDFPPTVRFSILARLHSFSFSSSDSADVLLPSFLAYGHARLEIHLASPGITGLITSLAAEQSPLLAQISHCDLNLRYSDGRFAVSPLIGLHLRNLTSLTLRLSLTSQSLRALAKCTALRTLHLDPIGLLRIPQPVYQLSDLIPMTSLTSLTITQIRNLHSHSLLTERLPLDVLFPSLTYFNFNYSPTSCRACPFDYQMSDPQLTDKQRACVRLMMAPLKKCPKLKRIVIPVFAHLTDYIENGQTWQDFPIEEL